jgi:phospholipid/cholesterol/gamma-HCH transport system substrate-binding protein
VFDNLKQLSDDIQTIVDPEKISAILAAVQEMTENLAKVSGTFNDRSADVSQAVRSYDALAGDIRRVVNENEPALSASLEDTQYLLQELAAALTPIMANIETASRNLAALSADLRQDPKSLLFNNPTAGAVAMVQALNAPSRQPPVDCRAGTACCCRQPP